MFLQDSAYGFFPPLEMTFVVVVGVAYVLVVIVASRVSVVEVVKSSKKITRSPRDLILNEARSLPLSYVTYLYISLLHKISEL